MFVALSFPVLTTSLVPPTCHYPLKETNASRWALRQVRKKWFSRLDKIENTFYYPIKEKYHKKENHHHTSPRCRPARRGRADAGLCARHRPSRCACAGRHWYDGAAPGGGRSRSPPPATER